MLIVNLSDFLDPRVKFSKLKRVLSQTWEVNEYNNYLKNLENIEILKNAILN